MWGAAKKEIPNPLSCRWTQQLGPCHPGFAEHALLHGQGWMLFLHTCRRVPKIIPQVSAPQRLFSRLNVQSHQRSSECEGISRKL